MKAYLLAGLLVVGGCCSERVALPLPARPIVFASKIVPDDSAMSSTCRLRPVASVPSGLVQKPGNVRVVRHKKVGYARNVFAPGLASVAAATHFGRPAKTTHSTTRKLIQPASPADGNEYKYAILFLAIALLAGFGITLLVGVAAGSLATVLIGAIGLVLTVPAAVLADKIIYRKLHPSFRR